MTDVADIAKGLTEAQRAFLLSLPSDDWKHWPRGMGVWQLDGLRGFGKSGLIESRYEHGGVYHRLSPAGLAVRNHLAALSNMSTSTPEGERP